MNTQTSTVNARITESIDQISTVVLGKREQIKLALTCLFARGHLLIEDLPGIGKTTLAKVLSISMGLQFRRIQCTSDMLPGDILGNSIFEQKSSAFVFHPGPIFTQVLLADEINRATPKTQSALLEAMEERQVTVEGTTRLLDEPFYVIATQNPLEQSGTFPLPESQLDRFLMRINVPVIPRRRGIFNPGPLTVSTRYPFGLVRCRFKLHVDVECLVYPEPLHGAPYGGGDGVRLNDGGRPGGDGVDDFMGFKAYQPGDPLKHIAWKALARGQRLLVREFAGQSASAVMIDWYAIPEEDVEKKLSLLCGMILKADTRMLEYGLRLPGQQIEPDRSERHTHDCLRALALFGSPQDG